MSCVLKLLIDLLGTKNLVESFDGRVTHGEVHPWRMEVRYVENDRFS
jgi:hypothetical protein